MRYCESHCYNLCICVRIICVVSQLPRLGQPSYAPASLCGMVILRLHARKQRRAVLSGAQKGICISLYQKKVWKFNSSCASQGVRARRCVCVFARTSTPGTHYIFLLFALDEKNSKQTVVCQCGRACSLHVCPAFLCQY